MTEECRASGFGGLRFATQGFRCAGLASESRGPGLRSCTAYQTPKRVTMTETGVAGISGYPTWRFLGTLGHGHGYVSHNPDRLVFCTAITTGNKRSQTLLRRCCRQSVSV